MKNKNPSEREITDDSAHLETYHRIQFSAAAISDMEQVPDSGAHTAATAGAGLNIARHLDSLLLVSSRGQRSPGPVPPVPDEGHQGLLLLRCVLHGDTHT